MQELGDISIQIWIKLPQLQLVETTNHEPVGPIMLLQVHGILNYNIIICKGGPQYSFPEYVRLTVCTVSVNTIST